MWKVEGIHGYEINVDEAEPLTMTLWGNRPRQLQRDWLNHVTTETNSRRTWAPWSRCNRRGLLTHTLYRLSMSPSRATIVCDTLEYPFSNHPTIFYESRESLNPLSKVYLLMGYTEYSFPANYTFLIRYSTILWIFISIQSWNVSIRYCSNRIF